MSVRSRASLPNRLFATPRRFFSVPRTRRFLNTVARGARSNSIRSVNNSNKLTNLDLNTFLDTIIESFYTLTLGKGALVTTLLVFLLWSNSGPLYDKGIVGKVIGNSTAFIPNFIRTYPNEFTGYLISLPFTVACPKSLRLSMFLATFCWVSVLPESFIYEYIIHFFGLFLLLSTSKRNVKIMVAIIMLISWYGGYLIFDGPVMTSYASSLLKSKYNITQGIFSMK